MDSGSAAPPQRLPPINPGQNPPPQQANYINPSQQNPVPPIQGQPQHAILVQQPVNNNNKNEKYASSCSIGLGGTQITIGILCIIFQVAAICVGAHVAVISTGIWCGLYFCLCGAFGIAAGKSKTTCLIVTHMILCIVAAAVFVFIVIGHAGAALGYDVWDYNYDYNGWSDYNDYYHDPRDCHWEYPHNDADPDNYTSVYMCCDYDVNGTYACNPDDPIYYDHPVPAVMPVEPHRNDSALAMSSILIILAVVELIIAICASVLGCINCCTGPKNTVAALQVQYLPVAGSSDGAPQILVISNGQAVPMGQVSAQYPSAAYIIQQPQGGTNISGVPVNSTNPAQPPQYRKSSPPPDYSAN